MSDSSEISFERRYFKGSFFSELFLSWIDPIIEEGNMTTFDSSMHMDLETEHKTEHTQSRFQGVWTLFRNHNNWKRPTISIYFSFRKKFFKMLAVMAIHDLLCILLPIFVKKLIIFIVEDKDQHSYNRGALLIFYLIILKMFIAISHAQLLKFKSILFSGINSALRQMVITKALKIPYKRNKSIFKKDSQWLIDTLPQEISNLAFGVAIAVSKILQILIFGIAVVSQLIGWSSLIMVTSICGFYWLAIHLFSLSKKAKERMDVNHQKYTKFLKKVAEGLSDIKSRGLETFYSQKVENLSKEYCVQLFQNKKLELLVILVRWVTPFVIFLFAIFVPALVNQELNSQVIFPLLTAITVLWTPDRDIEPLSILFKRQYHFLFKRFTSFQHAVEINIENLTHILNQGEIHALVIKESSFSWKIRGSITGNGLAPILKNVNIKVPHKGLIAIVGDYGSGKSSFFYSLLGDMIPHSVTYTKQTISGTLAYIDQNLWLPEDKTIRQIIVFGNSLVGLDEDRYIRILRKVCLIPDLQNLPNYDETYINDSRAKITDSIRAKICLARACYNNQDIFLMDQVLDKMNNKDASEVFNKCISQYLKSKTRILITNRLELLPQADEILVMKRGAILYRGSFERLKASIAYPYLKQVFNKPISLSNIQENLKDIPAENLQNTPPSKRTRSIELDDYMLGASTPRDSARTEDHMLGTEENTEEVEDNSLCQTTMLTTNESQIELQPLRSNRISSSSTQQLNDSPVHDMGGVEDVQNNYSPEVNPFVQGQRGSEVLNARQIMAGYVGGKLSIFRLITINALWMISVFLLLILLTIWSSISPQDGKDPNKNNSLYLKTYLIFLSINTLFFALKTHVIYNILQKGYAKSISQGFQQLLQSPLTVINQSNFTKTIKQRLTQDTLKTQNELFERFDYTLTSGLVFVCNIFLIVVFGSFWVITVCAAFYAMSWYLHRRYSKVAKQVLKMTNESKQVVLDLQQNTLKGLSVVRAFKKEKVITQEFLNANDEITKNCFLSDSLVGWFRIKVFFRYVVIIFCTLFTLVILKKEKDMNECKIALLIYLLSRLDTDIFAFLSSAKYLEFVLNSFQRICEFSRSQPEIIKSRNTKNDLQQNLIKYGPIVFQQFSTKYSPSSQYYLNKITFQIKEKEKVAIVGTNSSRGKAVLQALCRHLKVSQGLISINGKDIKNMDLDTLRQSIAYIPTSSKIAKDTLRNLLDPLTWHLDNGVQSAIKAVGLSKRLEELEIKLTTKISHQDTRLTKGFVQLLLLTRALLMKNKILLIEDLGSEGNEQDEKLLYNALNKKFSECTILFVTNKLTKVIEADKVIVMDKGTVLDFNSPSQIFGHPASPKVQDILQHTLMTTL